MSEQDKRAEEVCSICGDGKSQTWECPQCGREIQEADAAALRQAYREGFVTGCVQVAREENGEIGARAILKQAEEEAQRRWPDDLLAEGGSRE